MVKYANLNDRKIHPSIDEIRNAVRLLCTVNQKVCNLKAEDLVGDRIAKKLEEEGVF